MGKKQLQYTYCPITQRGKCNPTNKFDQLIDYNMRNIFLEKSYAKCGGESIRRPFSKESKLSISLHQQSEFLLRLFYCISKSMIAKIY